MHLCLIEKQVNEALLLIVFLYPPPPHKLFLV